MNYFRNIQLKKALFNTSAQFFVKIISSATTFFITLAIVYFFGLNNFGSFTKVITFVSFAYLLVDFGINSVFLKEYYKDVEKYFSNVVYLRLIISFTLFLLIGAVTIFLPYNPVTETGFSPMEKFWIMIYSLTIFTQGLFFSINTIFQKNLSYHLSIIPTIASIITTIVFVSQAINTKDLLFLFFAYPAGGTVYFITAFILSKRKYPLNLNTINFVPFSKHLLKASLPLGVMLFLNLLYFRADTILLSIFKTNSDVGIYGFAFKVFEFVIAFPTFFANSVYPILIEKENNQYEFSNHVRRYSSFLLAASFVFSLFIFIFSPLLSFFKPELSQTIPPLRILSLSIPFFFLTSILQWVFVIKNRKQTLLFIYFISMIFNIVLNILLIPSFGYIASSFITVISELFVLLLIVFFTQKYKLLSFSNKENKVTNEQPSFVNPEPGT